MAYHPRIQTVQDSAIKMADRTTQYISHGASWEGCEERRALKEAKIGKRIVMAELKMIAISIPEMGIEFLSYQATAPELPEIVSTVLTITDPQIFRT
jgi:aspartyl/asparaginyl beta-hydroxylase (cupin superfamily)